MTAVAADEDVPDWVGLLSRDHMANLFGEATVSRGASYERNGAVRTLTCGPGGFLSATVTGGRRYTTVVGPRRAETLFGGRLGVISDCSCPVGGSCKHVVAVILKAQARAALTMPGRGPARPGAGSVSRDWETLLSPLVRDPGTGRSAVGMTPLALLVDVAPAPTAGLPGRRRVGRTLQLRPMVPGARGGWIRTGISWSDVQHASRRRRIDPAHREALAPFLAAERIHWEAYYSPPNWVSAQRVGPVLWSLLDGAVAAGVVIVSGERGDQPVHVWPQPAEFVLDITQAQPDSPRASARGDATDVEGTAGLAVRTSLRVPGAPGIPEVIGAPPHGVFIASPSGLVLARFGAPLAQPLASLLDVGEDLAVPAPDVPRFLSRYYPALRRGAAIESSDRSVEFPTVRPPVLALHVDFEAEHRTRLRWTFRYRVGDEAIDAPLPGAEGPAARDGAESGDAEAVVRDAAAEQALLVTLDVLDSVAGLLRSGPGAGLPQVVAEPVLRGWSTVAFVRDVLPALQARDDVEVTISGTMLEYVEAEADPVVTVSTHDPHETAPEPDAPTHGALHSEGGPPRGSGEDWFDLGIAVTVGDEEVPLTGLLGALARGEEQLILDSGVWFSLDRPELHHLRRIVEEARALQDHESEGLRVNRYQAGLWEELVELGVVAHQSQRWQESVGALLALDEVPHPPPPEALTASLRPYQLDGYQWLSFLWDHRLGGILADDMGLGKTLQVLAAAQRARERGTLTTKAPVLVVAPTSVVAAWQREAARFTPGLGVVALTQTVGKSGVTLAEASEGAHLVVTSYALLRIDAEQYTAQPWAAMVLDEAQAVKNHQSRTYQVARSVRAPVKLAITGTPLENSLMDLWSLLSIVAPGLFPAPRRFAELYRKPIESGESPELLATLRRRIRPLMLRRTKEAVAADLPPKVEQVLPVPLNAAHRRIYDTHLQRERQRILGLLDDVDRNRVAILSALTTLRQLSLDVHLVVPEAPASVRSSKVDAMLDRLVDVVAEGHRCLVFSQFTRFLQTVRARLAKEGIDHVYLDGRTRNRPARIAQFTEGEAPVFLISLKAGGSGLTLTQADYVFVLDPWWNPAVEAQAVDRAHRIGQDKTVVVYRLVSEGTIEEKVVALQERKRSLFDRVVDEGGIMSAPLSADDIRGLLEG